MNFCVSQGGNSLNWIRCRKEEIRQKLLKKKESEERAHAIVLRLLENNETIDWIRDSVSFILLFLNPISKKCNETDYSLYRNLFFT